MLAKVPLLASRREWIFAGLVWLLLLSIHLLYLYGHYRKWRDRPFFYLRGEVLQLYPKHSERGDYAILKIRGEDGLLFFTRSHKTIPQKGQRVRLQLFPGKVSFFDYLKGPYLPSRIKAIENETTPSLSSRLQQAIDAQHESKTLSNFYQAIFLATPLERELRETISALGVNHLVALSGFHLSILWGGLFLILSPLYRRLQAKLFPWRYSLVDLGTFTLLLLAGYLWLTGPPPSLLRSYAMLLLGWATLLLGLEVFSFSFLGIVAALLLLLDPRLACSLGFWFSVAGVFYIYLLLHHWGSRSPWLFALLIMPVGIYLAMLPISHTIFPQVSPWQWISPLLSLLFALFYPLAILLHLVGRGDLFDPALQWLWSLPSSWETQTLPLWFGLSYIALSLLAVRFQWAFFGVGMMSLGAALWLYLF